MKDNIFSEKLDKVGNFEFNEKVVSVFPDMIDRSVPGYSTLVSLIGTIAANFAEPDAEIFDLGCSLGAVSFAVLANIPGFSGTITAVDNSDPMIRELRRIVAGRNLTSVISPVLADVRNIGMQNVSFAAMNLTLQFIPVKDRAKLIRKIYDGLKPGGGFVISEKISFASTEEQKEQEELLANFKRCRGYSELEIRQKREALENVLIPETAQDHIERLKSAGFATVIQWFQSFNFTSFLAIKES